MLLIRQASRFREPMHWVRTETRADCATCLRNGCFKPETNIQENREIMSSEPASTSFENILYTTENSIAYITLNRPKVLNALSRKTIEELKAEPANQ